MPKRRDLESKLQGDNASAVARQPLEPEPFRKALRTWYREHARVLPWRGIRNPYATWLSEVMLQQTRVATVLERYQAFLYCFPTLQALAEAPEDAVLALWSGLGYYRRARMLHRGAQFVQRELGGQLPRTAAALRSLPGVGEYTAAAIASIAFGESVAVLDGNVERVLLRLMGLGEDRSATGRAALLKQAHALVPATPRRRGLNNLPGDHNQAMMELGATLCLPRAPLCLQCPVLAFCKTRGEHTTPARKQLRSLRMACLLATRKRGTRTEILLERRPKEASLMAGMMELPPLPLDAVGRLEPILRLRHGITNTNYYAEVYAESSEGAQPLTLDEGGDAMLDGIAPLPFEEAASPGDATQDILNEDEAVYTPERGEARRPASLRSQLPAKDSDLTWVSGALLYSQPLTGLARKALQRLGLMPMQRVRVGKSGTV